MPSRTPRLEVSVDGFHTLTVIALLFADSTHPDVPTGWTWDSAVMPTSPDPLAAIYGAQLDLAEYKANDLLVNKPRDRSEDSPFGGPNIARSAKAADGSSTFTIQNRPGSMPDVLGFEVLNALPAWLAAQGFTPPSP